MLATVRSTNLDSFFQVDQTASRIHHIGTDEKEIAVLGDYETTRAVEHRIPNPSSHLNKCNNFTKQYLSMKPEQPLCNRRLHVNNAISKSLSFG